MADDEPVRLPGSAPPWHVPAMLAAATSIMLGILAVGLYLGARGGDAKLSYVQNTVLGMAAFHLAGALAVLLVLARAVPTSAWDRELCLRPLGGWQVAKALGWFVLASAVILGLDALLQAIWRAQGWKDDEQAAVRALLDCPWHDFLVLAVAAIVVAPVIEELLFRLVLQRGLTVFIGGTAATWCTAMAFGVVHGSVQHFVPLLLLGLVLQRAFQRSGSLWLPILLHALFNAFNVLQILLQRLG